MPNFDDMTLEELQQLLKVNKANTKDADDVKRIQEMSGLTGKAVDGIWGKQTSKAWDDFLIKNRNDIVQAIEDEEKYQNAMANGQKSPAVEDIVSYSEQLDEQNSYRNEKISQLEQQIAQVKARIASNERELNNSSYEDVNNKLGELEMSKIGFRLNKPSVNQDPTSFWRWNTQRLDTKKANDKDKSNTAKKFVNEAEALIKTTISPDYAEQVQQLRNVRNKIAEGKTLGYDVSGLESMENEIQSKVDKTYGNLELVKTIKNKLKNLDQQLTDKTITPEQYTAAVNKLKGEDFDNDELRNELDTKSKLGSKKGADADKAAIEKKAKELAAADLVENWDHLSEQGKAEYRKKAKALIAAGGK